MTIAEAAARYHVSRDYIRRCIIDGSLPAVRSGKRIIRVNSLDLERLVPSRPVDALPVTELRHYSIAFAMLRPCQRVLRRSHAAPMVRSLGRGPSSSGQFRQAAAGGMSQTQIAAEIGRSQA